MPFPVRTGAGPMPAHFPCGSSARPSDPRFVMLLAAQTVNSVGGWACGIALWGFAAYRYHAGPLPVALLTLCWAAPPAVLGMPRFPGRLMSRWPGRLTGVRAAAVAACGYGVSAAAFAGTPWIPVAYAGAFAWGVSGAVFAVILTTALQQQVPVQAHGRVMGLAAALYSAADTAWPPLPAGLACESGTVRVPGPAITAGRRWPVTHNQQKSSRAGCRYRRGRSSDW
jgi:hypothetical protein